MLSIHPHLYECPILPMVRRLLQAHTHSLLPGGNVRHARLWNVKIAKCVDYDPRVSIVALAPKPFTRCHLEGTIGALHTQLSHHHSCLTKDNGRHRRLIVSSAYLRNGQCFRIILGEAGTAAHSLLWRPRRYAHPHGRARFRRGMSYCSYRPERSICR